jgi:putative holliday junction resolvase
MLETRILGLDVGTKTIGLAVSDLMGWTAQPLTTIRRQNEKVDFQALKKVIEENNVSELVVGYPKNMNGSIGEQAQYVDAFLLILKKYISLPVTLEDERLTSKLANDLMMASNVKADRRKEIIDQQAAALILQSFLDRKQKQK